MNIERALTIPGWMSDRELSYLAFLAQQHSAIAEIGSWRGRSARAFSDNTPGTVLCVDTWADDAYGAVFPGDAPDLCQHRDWLWSEFRRNLSDRIGDKLTCWRMPSVDGAKKAQSLGLKLDLIFIDAGHNYEDVIADIESWRPLLAPGGVLCGHDYVAHHEAVIRAVDQLVARFGVVDTIWTTEPCTFA
jgi:predicted O-methyltransferase YrrM